MEGGLLAYTAAGPLSSTILEYTYYLFQYKGGSSKGHAIPWYIGIYYAFIPIN